jgi:hypothetical protein
MRSILSSILIPLCLANLTGPVGQRVEDADLQCSRRRGRVRGVLACSGAGDKHGMHGHELCTLRTTPEAATPSSPTPTRGPRSMAKAVPE